MSNISTKELSNFPKFREIPDEQLQWLAGRLEVIQFQTGEYVFKKGDPIDWLILILEGSFEMYLSDGKSRKTLGQLQTHDIGGLLPYSRATVATGFGQATSPARIGRLHRQDLRDLIINNYELTEVLVHEMNNRIRTFTESEIQNEKLIALGKLSAGLAHELNNPAAAMVRSAHLLEKHLQGLPEDFKRVLKIKANDEVIDAINNFTYQKLGQKPDQLTLMQRSALEDDLEDWFDDCDLEDKYELIPLLVDYQFTPADLDKVHDLLSEEDFNPVLRWIVQNITTHQTVRDIRTSANRIEELIKSVKTYSYMDRSLDFQPLDLHEGLQATLRVLDHKLSKAGHIVETYWDADLPRITGLPGELNQVWTNLIDNAIDAMPEQKGKLVIRTQHAGANIEVQLTDNGHGIPEDIRRRIFEPFYTTKDMGKGTGLGLDIVNKIIRQHHGGIKVDSRPGQTTFTITLPIQTNS